MMTLWNPVIMIGSYCIGCHKKTLSYLPLISKKMTALKHVVCLLTELTNQ